MQQTKWISEKRITLKIFLFNYRDWKLEIAGELELRRKSSIEIVFKWILSNSTIIFTIVVLSYS